jgi:hypothetical protein
MNELPLYLLEAGAYAKPDPIPDDNYVPSAQHVMSRDADGKVISVFGDASWNFTMYVGKGLTFHIEDFIRDAAPANYREKYLEEFKIIFFRIIFHARVRAMNSVAELYQILKRHTRFAIQTGLSIEESLKDRSTLDLIVNDPEVTKASIGRRLVDANTLFSSLHYLSVKLDNFKHYPSQNIFKYLDHLMKEYPYQPQQTPVIPTRILSRRIQTCFDYIEKFIECKHQFAKLYEFREVAFREYLSRNNNTKKYAGWQSGLELKEEMKKEEYKEFLTFFEVHDFITLRGLISKVRLPIIEMIHAFSGMRVGESASIAMDGYQIKTIGRQNVPIIRSYTTKMAKDQGYFADWVTSPEIEKAFEAAKIINYVFLFHEYGLAPEDVDESEIPLFLGSRFGSKNKGNSALYDYTIAKLKLNGWHSHPINRDPEIIVREDDLAEILAIDPFSDPETLKPGIEIGQPFSFQTHMYRRSLAVYCARSGLVSLPTLKKQFKHLRVQTSAYYGKDAVFAKNFVLSKSGEEAFDSALTSQRGFIKEFQDELMEAQADLLHDQVITFDEVVFGGMGTQIQKQKFSGTLPTIFTDRKKLLASIKKGRVRFVETPLGGCMATEVCDRIAFSSITTCVGCKFSVFNSRTVPLLEKTKADYGVRLEQFGTGTPYGRQLERDIRDIETVLAMREKLIKLVDVTEASA